MADFPTTLPSFATLVDDVDDVLASHQNAPNAEIVALAMKLGVGAGAPAAGKVLLGVGAGESGWQDYLAVSGQGSGAGLLVGGDVQWYRSAADVWRTPDSVRVDAYLGIGADPAAAAPLDVLSSVSTSARQDAIRSDSSQAGTDATNTAVVAGQFTSRSTNATGSQSFNIAIGGAANHEGAGNQSALIGMQLQADHRSTGAVTNLFAMRFFPIWRSSGGSTNGYGIWVQPLKLSTGGPTNMYGLYIADINQGSTLNYAIYTNAGNLRFGGSSSTLIGFRGATPVASPDYTVTNPSTSRSLDVSGATLAQLRAVVGTMIQDLINVGLYH